MFFFTISKPSAVFRWATGEANAHIDVHLLSSREEESEAPIQRIDLGQGVRLVVFSRLSHEQFLFGAGKYVFVYEEREGGGRVPWRVVLIDPKLGSCELEKMRKRRRKLK